MRLADHLTDVQLNEYLDNESAERAQIESHLAECADCAARLTALRTLFAEIESLPELELTQSIAARVSLPSSLPVPQLPAWLTLTAALQAIVALIALIFAAPFIASLVPAIETPSLTQTLIQLQTQWAAWLDLLSSFHFPTLPKIPAFDISSLVIAITIASVSMLWLVGSGLLLRKQIK